MAAQLNTSAPAARSYNRTNDESWKAQGFINISIAMPDGSSRKLGAIPLKDSKASERALREWLHADPEANCEKLLSSLTLDYRPAEDESKVFDFAKLGTAPDPTKP